MKSLITFSFLFFLLLSTGIAQSKTDFLLGKWKLGGQDYYEVWRKSEDGHLVGESYRINNGQKVISKKLIIRQSKGKVLYEVNYVRQDDYKTVQFILNEGVKNNTLSFEVEGNSILTKIAYQQETNRKVKVKIIEPDGKGFSYYLVRQYPRKYNSIPSGSHRR